VTDAPAHPRDGRIESVSSFELFFDLVFVFAFTQVTTFLVHDPSWHGLANGMLLLAALWWAWGGYAWLATTIDLEEDRTRIPMIGVMCAMLVVGVATPDAFGTHALHFALAYAIVRSLHVIVYALAARDDPALARNVLLLVPGATVSAVLILLASQYDGWAVTVLWTIGMLFDYAGPLFSNGEGWTVSASHFAERHGLIFIIALGESLIALGVGAGALEMDGTFLVLGSLGVITITALWWTYFDTVALVAERRLHKAHGLERSRMARDSYSYLHLPMVAGVILYALGVKKALGHPFEPLAIVPATALVGGVALYLVAHVLFRLRNIHTLNRQRLFTSAALVAILAALGTRVHAGWLVSIVAVVMALLVAYEALRFRDMRRTVRRRDWAPEHASHPERGPDALPR
jgi:low temperature requirement protein LtrA